MSRTLNSRIKSPSVGSANVTHSYTNIKFTYAYALLCYIFTIHVTSVYENEKNH